MIRRTLLTVLILCLTLLFFLSSAPATLWHRLHSSLSYVEATRLAAESSSIKTRSTNGAAVVDATAVANNVLRIGLNMDLQSQYDDRAYLQNYLDNPGFEQAMVGHVIIVGPGPSSSGFIDINDSYDAVGTGFWSGITASVRTGASAGATFSVTSYVAGGTYTCSCPPLAKGDLVVEVSSNMSLGYVSARTLPGNWIINNSDAGISLSTAQHYDGASSALFDVHDGSAHSIEFGMDTSSVSVGTCSNDSVTFCQANSDCGAASCNKAPNYPWHPLSGAMSMSVWALASNTGAASTITLEISRAAGSWNSVSHTFALIQDGTWHQYAYNFTGSDKSADTGVLMFIVTANNGAMKAGAEIYADNVFLGPTSGAAGGFRNEVLSTLRTLKPGTLRYMIPEALTQTDAYFEGNDYEKGPSNEYSVGAYFSWYFSLKDMYAMAGAIGADPWISIPDVFADADISAFAANLCKAFTNYGFTKAFVEQSNEDWASSSHTAGGSATAQYGKLANRNFGLIETVMTQTCPSYASKVNFIVNGQENNGGVLVSTSAQIPSNNPQYGGDIANYVPSQTEQNTGQTISQYATLGFSNSLNQFTTGVESNSFANAVPGNIGNLCGGKPTDCRQFLTVYENGSSNQCGTANPIEAWEMSAGWIAAGFNGQNWILGFSAGSGGINLGKLYPMPAQNTFNFAQLEYTTANAACGSGHGTDSALWGVAHDLDSNFGPAFPHLRPIGWAMALANRAIAGAYYQMDTSGFSGVYGAAFNSGNSWSALLSNSNNRAISIPIAFPAGALPSIGETVLYSNTIADNNENSNLVKIGPLPGGIVASGRTITVTLPPLSLVALEQ